MGGRIRINSRERGEVSQKYGTHQNLKPGLGEREKI
jgi:hypothetical protein